MNYLSHCYILDSSQNEYATQLNNKEVNDSQTTVLTESDSDKSKGFKLNNFT